MRLTTSDDFLLSSYFPFLVLFFTVHCNTILQCKPMKCTLPQVNILIFDYLLHVSTLRVHLQEDGCVYSQWRTQEFCSGGRGSTNSVEDRERGSGGGSPPTQGFWRQL